jgi:hypothetical protein
MIFGGGVAVVVNTAPYSANRRFSTGVDRVDASSISKVCINFEAPISSLVKPAAD